MKYCIFLRDTVIKAAYFSLSYDSMTLKDSVRFQLIPSQKCLRYLSMPITLVSLAKGPFSLKQLNLGSE
jgi:hypothetical protein